MNLLPSDDQTQILDALRAFLAAEAPVERLRVHGEVGNPDAALLPALGELGFLALALPEAKGGSGLTAAEEMLASREFGRFLISPAILAALAAGQVLAESGADPALLARVAQGQARVGLANPRRLPAPDGVHLIETEGAELVLAWSDRGVEIWPRDAFHGAQPVPPMDATLDMRRARDPAGAPLARSGAATPGARRLTLMLAAYAVGLSEAARDLAVDYAKVREQFGKPIGAFQAVKHRCAEMAMRCEAALCQATFAGLTLAEDHPDAAFHLIAAKMVATDAALRNAADCIQVHGAFGFTSEAPVHHYLKRAHLFDHLGGDMRAQRRRLMAEPTPA